MKYCVFKMSCHFIVSVSTQPRLRIWNALLWPKQLCTVSVRINVIPKLVCTKYGLLSWNRDNHSMDNQKDLLGVRKSKNFERCRLCASYLEPAVAVYAIGHFMNYTLLQQYVYFRVANNMGLPVEYMRKERGGCDTNPSNFTNTSVTAERFADIEAKVDHVMNKVNHSFLFSRIRVDLYQGAWSE